MTFDAPSVQSGVPTLPIGGVMRVDLLSIPPFPKQVNTWLMRTVTPRGLERNEGAEAVRSLSILSKSLDSPPHSFV